jgi:hypothetical protein
VPRYAQRESAGGHIETSRLFAFARPMSCSAWRTQTYKSATIGEPMASTGRIFVVAGCRQYRQGASKLMRRTLDLSDGWLGRSADGEGAHIFGSASV